MQPKSRHGTAVGFRVLNANAAADTVRRHSRFPFAALASESDAIHRRPDRTIDMDLYRRRIAASRCEARGSAVLTSAWAGVLAMIAIYLALFFTAEQTRTSNRSHAAVPMVAMPNAPDILF